MFSKIRQAWNLYKHIDFGMLSRLSSKVDLTKLMQEVGTLDETQLAGLVKSLNSAKTNKVTPPIDSDFYHLSHMLSKEERALQQKVRDFMEKEIQPIVNDFWLRGEFPFEIIPKMATLNICGLTYKGYGCPGLSTRMEAVLAMEMARVFSW